AKGFFRDGLVAPVRSPGAALVAAAKMNTDQHLRLPLDVSNHRIVRRDRRVQGLDGIDAARLQRCPALWVEEGRIRRRVELDIGGAFVDQRLDFVPHDRCDILEHVPNSRIKLVGYHRPEQAYCMLGGCRCADFKWTGRVLLQKRRLARSEAAFLAELSADDELEIALL